VEQLQGFTGFRETILSGFMISMSFVLVRTPIIENMRGRS